MKEVLNFFYMNGYGFYIWSAYVVATFFIIVLILSVILRKKKIEKKILNFENK